MTFEEGLWLMAEQFNHYLLLVFYRRLLIVIVIGYRLAKFIIVLHCNRARIWHSISQPKK